MNEQFKKLIVQAIKEVGPDDADSGAKDLTLQRFAELIVKECIAALDEKVFLPATEYDGDEVLHSEVLLNHFGIK